MNEADDWTPRPDEFTVMVHVSSEESMDTLGDFQEWMVRLRQTIGAGYCPGPEDPQNPWAVSGWNPANQYGIKRRDHYGHLTTDKNPYAYIWQYISGEVASVAMAYVWAAIHLVKPIEEAGFSITDVWAGLTDKMVLLA